VRSSVLWRTARVARAVDLGRTVEALVEGRRRRRKWRRWLKEEVEALVEGGGRGVG
jgi:hypothetical protein